MRVLIAYDGSAGATEGVALAAAVAWPSDSTIRVVSVIEPMMPNAGTIYGGAALAPGVDEEITAYTRETMEGVVERLRSPGRTVEGEVLRGRVASAIIDDARESRADLLVIGSRGHGTIASLLLGSVSSEVVDHVHCPVLVARTTNLTSVVFATDGSPSAEAAERILSAWPIFAGVPIHVVSVTDVVRPWTTGIAPTMYSQVLDAYAAELRELRVTHERLASDTATRLRDGGLVADAEVRDGDVAAEIIAVVERQGADLVVLGSRGRTGLTRLLLGSVARNVLSGSTASVLIVREEVQGSAEPETAPS